MKYTLKYKNFFEVNLDDVTGVSKVDVHGRGYVMGIDFHFKPESSVLGNMFRADTSWRFYVGSVKEHTYEITIPDMEEYKILQKERDEVYEYIQNRFFKLEVVDIEKILQYTLQK